MIDQIIKTERKWLGTHENPPGSNNVVFNTDYYGREVSGSAYPWCCVFQWDCFRMAGMSDLFFGGQKTASCTTLFNYYKAKGLTGKTPKVGCLVIYQFKSSRHIGLCTEVISKTKIRTIEGNTSANNKGDQANGDQVAERVRPTSQVYGYIYPEYTTKVHTTREITVWSAPAKIDENRGRTIPAGYEVTVYEIPFDMNGETWYKTIKGKYVLAKYCI